MGESKKVMPFNFYCERLYMPSEILIEVVKNCSDNATVINADAPVEAQTKSIMKSLEIKLLFDFVVTVVSSVLAGINIVSAVIDPEPTTKAILIVLVKDGVASYFLISSASSAFNYFKANDFKNACLDGNLNIVFTKSGYESFDNLWEPWTTSCYINKFSYDSMNGRVRANVELNISIDDIIEYIGL